MVPANSPMEFFTVQVNLFVADGAEIGLKIRGGMEHGLGIFIASVERHSGADRAGIQVRY